MKCLKLKMSIYNLWIFKSNEVTELFDVFHIFFPIPYDSKITVVMVHWDVVCVKAAQLDTASAIDV